MAKMLATFKADKSLKNAQKLVRYVDAHMMALCFASAEDNALIEEARNVIKICKDAAQFV